MVAYRMIFLAGAAAALPLNINLGAYSPALVVGDGEISFGGKQDVSGLMSVLQGAAQSAAGAATNAAAPAAAAPAAAAAPVAAVQQQGAAQPAIVSDTTSTITPPSASVDPTLQEQANQIAALQGMGMGKSKAVAPRDEPSVVSKRDLASFDRALKFAEAALTKGPTIKLGTGEENNGSGVGISVENTPAAGGATAAAAAPAAAKRDLSEESVAVSKRDLASFDRALKFAEAALTKGPTIKLGTGEENGGSGVGISVQNTPAAGGAAAAKRDLSDESVVISKRDLASFDRALKFAEAALTKGPTIKLGTGEENNGSGVGISVENTPAAAAAAGKKRDLGSGTTKVKVTTMYVRSGIPSSLQSGDSLSARDIIDAHNNQPRYETIQIAPNKRDGQSVSGAIDAVNLNVSGDEGVTMTFVETVESTDDDDA